MEEEWFCYKGGLFNGGEWSCLRGGQFNGGRMVMLRRWPVSRRENGHATEVVSLMNVHVTEVVSLMKDHFNLVSLMEGE